MTPGLPPAIARAAAADSTPSGYVVPSGLRGFREAICGAEAAAAYARWRELPLTKKLFLALQDAVLHPGVVQSSDVPVQFGVTQGLAFAAQLVSDPSVIWPGVFDGCSTGLAVESGPPPESYDTTVDAQLDT